MKNGPLFSLNGAAPQVGVGVYIAPTAAVIGDVVLCDHASIWFAAVVRGDDLPVYIGAGTNIQDGAVVHGTEGGEPVRLGADVVVGHGAILHGCVVDDSAMVGMGAVLLDGVHVGKGAVVAAGSLVPPGRQVGAGELWAGNPAQYRRPVGAAEVAFLKYAPDHYRARAALYTTKLKSV